MRLPDVIATLDLQRGPALALVVALGLALAARALRRPLPVGLAGGVAVLVGWWLTFGLLTASPRQLPERLPLLLLMLLLATLILLPLALRWRRLAPVAALLGALAAGWWMAGAPLVRADLQRAAPVLLAVASATLLLALRMAPRWSFLAAAASLLAGLLLVPLPGPPPVLGAVLVAAALGAAWVPARGEAAPAVAALPVAGAITGLAALPVIARGVPADWAVAAAPLCAVLLGIPLGGWLAGRTGAALGAILAGGGCAFFAFLIR